MCIRDRVWCLRLGKLRFCFGNPIEQESDFLLDVPDNGIGCLDPAVELALFGAYAFLPVSYTHLDVYKRQEYANLKDYIQAVIVPDMQKKLRPVSYTHLDVYKRQSILSETMEIFKMYGNTKKDME